MPKIYLIDVTNRDGVRMAKEVVAKYFNYGLERPRDILNSIAKSVVDS